MPRWYGVTSPPFMWTDAVLEDGSGPMYEERNWVPVFARNARRAKVLALRFWRRKRNSGGWRSVPWLDDNESDGVCPFTDMKTERLNCAALEAEDE